MPLRYVIRSAVLLILAGALSVPAEAQRSKRTPRKKPFEALSQSAQRLKDSLSVRLVGASIPRFDSVTANGAFGAQVQAAPQHDALITMARAQLGTRYVFGADRPGQAFDCSSLVKFVMSVLRIELPRTAREQATQGVAVAMDPTVLKPGDLLTFGRGKRVSHIGVYVGQGRFVHASTSRHQVVEASIDQPNTWFRKNWVGVRRLVASIEPTDTVALR
jgi:cell wall-associated NlpC family hydrolase